MGLPIVGGLISSVTGILTGTAYGIAPQLPARSSAPSVSLSEQNGSSATLNEERPCNSTGP
jgi:hypothetical protein